MTRHRCADCGHEIPNGTGHVRSENFRQVAYCDYCWAVDHDVSLPDQRRPSEVIEASLN